MIKTDTKFPLLMGILNITPDSFSDAGENLSLDKALMQCEEMIADGADIIDIGGESTRPGAEEVSSDLELSRIIPVIERLRQISDKIKISVDTTKYEVARVAVDAGADIINDVSGLNNDIRLAELSASEDKTLIIMHMLGNPRTMQDNPRYDDLIEDIKSELKSKINVARNIGVSKIYADVGIGFGKTYEDNLKLLKYHYQFSELGVPMMLGISRKSFIGKLFDIERPGDRDAATAIIHSAINLTNVGILRVHNVKLHSQLRKAHALFCS